MGTLAEVLGCFCGILIDGFCEPITFCITEDDGSVFTQEVSEEESSVEKLSDGVESMEVGEHGRDELIASFTERAEGWLIFNHKLYLSSVVKSYLLQVAFQILLVLLE